MNRREFFSNLAMAISGVFALVMGKRFLGEEKLPTWQEQMGPSWPGVEVEVPFTDHSLDAQRYLVAGRRWGKSTLHREYWELYLAEIRANPPILHCGGLKEIVCDQAMLKDFNRKVYS